MLFSKTLPGLQCKENPQLCRRTAHQEKYQKKFEIKLRYHQLRWAARYGGYSYTLLYDIQKKHQPFIGWC